MNKYHLNKIEVVQLETVIGMSQSKMDTLSSNQKLVKKQQQQQQQSSWMQIRNFVLNDLELISKNDCKKLRCESPRADVKYFTTRLLQFSEEYFQVH